MTVFRAWGLMFVAAVGLIPGDRAPRPTPAPPRHEEQETALLIRWEAPDGRFTYTMGFEGRECDARPASREWDPWNGWYWVTDWQFTAAERTPLEDLWLRAYLGAIEPPPEKPTLFDRIERLQGNEK